MPPTRNHKTTVELTDDEAYELLRSRLYDHDGHFGRSVEAASFDEFEPWQTPPARYRLSIDDVLDELLSRRQPPRIDRSRSDNRWAVNYDGPYKFARFHLEFAAKGLADPQYEADRAERADALTDYIDDAMRALLPVMDYPWYQIANQIRRDERQRLIDRLPEEMKTNDALREHTNVGKAVIGWQQDLNIAFRSLTRLRHLVAAERDTVRISNQVMGRPKMLWKSEFISRIAWLWYLLTHDEPSRSEDSLFGSFVYSAWNSYGDDMPEVSFARAIRERT